MSSSIDPNKPADGVPAVKTDLRANLQATKDEIEALQGGVGLADGSIALAKLAPGSPGRFVAFNAGGVAVESEAPGLTSVAVTLDRVLTAADLGKTLVGRKSAAGDLALDLPDGLIATDTAEITIVNAQAAGKLVTVERTGTLTFIVDETIQATPAHKIGLRRGQAGALLRVPGESLEVLAIGPWTVVEV